MQQSLSGSPVSGQHLKGVPSGSGQVRAGGQHRSAKGSAVGMQNSEAAQHFVPHALFPEQHSSLSRSHVSPAPQHFWPHSLSNVQHLDFGAGVLGPQTWPVWQHSPSQVKEQQIEGLLGSHGVPGEQHCVPQVLAGLQQRSGPGSQPLPLGQQ
jgi:hypothetical protein